MKTAVLALGLAFAAGACASKGTAAGSQAPTATGTARRTNVISAQEIRESAAQTLADLVRQVRPGWPSQVRIYVNNDDFGDYTSLRNLALSNTSEVRYLSKSEAQMKWGPRAQWEVIQVITR
jgi:hypothetical protein